MPGHISDRIGENVHSSHIQFLNFKSVWDDRLETCKIYRAMYTIPLSFLQILDLYTVATQF